MNVSLIGGSDAHYLQKVGRVTTNFYDEIETEDQLIEAIRKGACEVQYDIQKSYKPELIQAIPKDELNILERFIEIRREPQAAIIESVGKRIRFIDANLQK
ncbi:MAG: PHP-associated domain-containing protein [Candidatus Heimdallarchaeota archaeon]